MIEFAGLQKLYPSTHAGIQEINAQFKEGEWVALLGPSGSGKSTLLKLIAGLEEQSSGSIQTPYSRKETSFVFQDAALLPWLTVMENVLLPIRMRPGHAVPTEKVRYWIEKLKLTSFVDRYPSELSGGMKMRVSLARALVTDPKLLLLDEPFAALDEPIRIELGLELRDLWKQLKPTVFFVTHSITEAIWLADRVIVLQGQPGRVALDEALPFGLDRPLSVRGAPEFLSKVEKCFSLLRGGPGGGA